MSLEHSTSKYDSKFQTILHYKNFPQMIPWVGTDYDKKDHKKILFIGESHYLPKDSIIHETPDKWYSSSDSNLNVEEKRWINTRGVMKKNENQKYNSPSQVVIFGNIETVIQEAMEKTKYDYDESKQQFFRYCAFYNFFQRPAHIGDSLEAEPQDIKVAIETFEKIVSILKPDFVYIVSSKVWYLPEMQKVRELKNADFSPHPSCSWWNRPCHIDKVDRNLKVTGKEKLLKFLETNKVF